MDKKYFGKTEEEILKEVEDIFYDDDPPESRELNPMPWLSNGGRKLLHEAFLKAGYNIPKTIK